MTAALLLVAVVVASISGDCETQKIRLDLTPYPPALPTSPVAVGLDVVGVQLWVNNGNGWLWFSSDGKAAGGKQWVCPGNRCPGESPADYDWVCYNLSTCPGCTWYVPSCWFSGSWVSTFDHKTVIEIGGDSEGAYTFRAGGNQYIVSTGWTAPGPDGEPVSGCGYAPNQEPTLWMVAGSGLVRIQCLEFGFGNVRLSTKPPQFLDGMTREYRLRYEGYHAAKTREATTAFTQELDTAKSVVAISELRSEYELAASGGGVSVLNGARVGPDRVILVTSDARVTMWQHFGAGADLRMHKLGGPEPRAGSHFGKGFEVRRTATSCQLVTSHFAISALWSCARPEFTKLADLPHPGHLGGIASFSPDGRLAYIGQVAGRWAQLYDVSDPTNPIPIDSGIDLPYPPPYQRQAHYDAEPWGQGLELADFTVELVTDVSGCSAIMFEDGFESGDFSEWSGNFPE